MRRKCLTAVVPIWLLLLAAVPTSAKVIYVDGDAIGLNDGSSWENAYQYLQDALADANSSAKPVEIRVGQGVYKPDQGAGQTPGDREATFQLINGVTVKGGYAGSSELDPNAHDIEAHKTILSGDLAGNDVSIDEPADLREEPTRSDNSYQVVTASGTDSIAVLDGFTVISGTAEPDPSAQGPTVEGGGMYSAEGSPTVMNCAFTANWASFSGGGISAFGGSPTFINCAFRGNWAAYDGGGMYCENADLMLVDCSFSGNLAKQAGGGICTVESNCTIASCSIIGNSTTRVGYRSDGGGIYCCSGSLNMCNSIVSGNRTNSDGGGLAGDGTTVSLQNCTISNNSARYSGGGVHFGPDTRATIVDSILWDNTGARGAEVFLESALPIVGEAHFSTLMISYSDVRGGESQVEISYKCELGWGQANIDTDPCFANPGRWVNANDPNQTIEVNDPNAIWIDGDYHLKSQAGRWDPRSKTWVKDDVTSPCIDAGDPMSPIGHEPFPNGGTINMGAYGGTAEASKSYFGEPICETIVASDINGDCRVDFEDFILLALHWLQEREFSIDY